MFRSGKTSYRVVPMTGLSRPWALAFLPNGDMLITERGGRLRLVRNGALDPQEIAGVPPVLHHRGFGLMDIALHPGFAENHLVYFTYSKPRAGEKDVAAAAILRARIDGDHTLSDVRDVFVSNAWSDQASMSRLVFGRDGKIYMSIGMTHPGRLWQPAGRAGSRQPRRQGASAQRRRQRAVGQSIRGPSRLSPEIYALGIRNALALIVHPQTGEIGTPRMDLSAETRSTSSGRGRTMAGR